MKPLLLLVVFCSALLAKPNIVFVITDDQGYGDLACHGNPIVKTPHLDQLHAESTALTDYHVAPTCSPTRASLLTGHWSNRTGVWHTVNGRSMLREDEITIATMLSQAGYATGHFGKWHLGDNFPYRPEDRGFAEVYRHGGGGVGQTPDVWDNSYFDGSYIHNGKIVPAKGFCTDVFFAQANRWIRDCVQEKKPFFAYITTNAPHSPLHCPQKYLDLYPAQPKSLAAFYGMISNIDDNVARTRQLLTKLGVAKDTIFIFTTDNGTAYGEKVFNAAMSGKKGSPLEGGHRVPFFLHWPAGGFDQAAEVDELMHAVDIVPTLLDLTKTPNPGVKFDGLPLATIVKGQKTRFLVTDSQRVRDPVKWKSSSVMSNKWRLINGKKLYRIDRDPGQKKNIAKDHPEQVAAMRAFYESWWADLSPTYSQTTEIHLGHPQHPVVEMTSHDWIQERNPPWNQKYVRQMIGKVESPEKLGHWAVKVLKGGEFTISLHRWPNEAKHPITAGLPSGENVPGTTRAFRNFKGAALKTKSAVLMINGKRIAKKPVTATDTHITFATPLSKGTHELAPYFEVEGGVIGSYYCTVMSQ